MKNPMMRRLLGENDVVPVIANVPRETFRNRMVKARQIKDEDGAADDSVERMVKEAVEDPSDRDEDIIPDDAEPIDSTEMVVGKPLREPKEVVQEPSHPTGEKEKYQTPYAALTAPDVTPQATVPIDPSQVPGAAGPERFMASDLERATPEGEQRGDIAAKAMDVLLGRNRASKPATQPGEFEQAGAIQTEEEAAAALGIQTPIQEEAKARAASAVVAATEGGSAMPPPAPQGDGKAIYSAFRRFVG